MSRWKEDHPDLAPLYERLGLFSVYDSPWFSAIYLLLMVSLVGCIVPRTAVYWRALRAAPPPAPRNLRRLPAYAAARDRATRPTWSWSAARDELRRRRYRVVDPAPTAGGTPCRAERGYLREAGNLLFHVSVIVVLVGVRLRPAVRLQGRRDRPGRARGSPTP